MSSSTPGLIGCTHPGCTRTFTSRRGLARHLPAHAPDEVCECGWTGRNLVVHNQKAHGIDATTTQAFVATSKALAAALEREQRLTVLLDRDRAARARKDADWAQKLADSRKEAADLRDRLDICLADTTPEEKQR